MNDNLYKTTRSRKKRIFFRSVKVILLIYVIVGMGLYYFQEKILLHPEPLSEEYAYKFHMPFKEVNIPINKNENLNIIQFLPKNSVPRGIVLYFHGNMKNINHYAKAADHFTKLGYEVWMPDYPGFGKTTGELTEKKLYDHALQVYKLANKKCKHDSIIIYGRSFGSGIASQLASYIDCKRLILETPYYSIPALFSYYAPIYPTSYMSKFKLPVKEYLKEVTVPVTIFHGTDDEIIPYGLTKTLKEILKPGDEFITIEKGKHNDLFNFDIVVKKIDSLLK